jgi:hypothetical protein
VTTQELRFGYGLFRIYDQGGTPVAMRCNVVFVSRRLALRNPRIPRLSKRKPPGFGGRVG